MLKRYREIRDRYSEAAPKVAGDQMIRDLQALLRYVDLLHEGLARQAAEHLVSEAFETFDAGDGSRSATH